MQLFFSFSSGECLNFSWKKNQIHSLFYLLTTSEWGCQCWFHPQPWYFLSQICFRIHFFFCEIVFTFGFLSCFSSRIYLGRRRKTATLLFGHLQPEWIEPANAGGTAATTLLLSEHCARGQLLPLSRCLDDQIYSLSTHSCLVTIVLFM